MKKKSSFRIRDITKHIYFQMFYANPYMPMMYPNPYTIYHPHYGPLVYRPPVGMYPSVPGRGSPQGPSRKQQQNQRQKAAQAQALPLQRDDEDRSSSESPRSEKKDSSSLSNNTSSISDKQVSEPPPQARGLLATPHQVMPGSKKAGQKRWIPVNVVPRMPVYQPFYTYPQYYLPPDDPRLQATAAGLQPPYFYQYAGVPRQPVPFMMPQMVQVQPRPGSGSVSPASSSEGSASRLATSPQGSSREQHDGGPPQSLSPNSSQTSHYIQLLPNVKHVPSHLLYNSPGSGSTSRSSTPVHTSSPVPPQQTAPQPSQPQQTSPTVSQQPPIVKSTDSPQNFAHDVEALHIRKRQHSGPRPVSQSPSFSSQSSHESSASPILNGEQPAFKVENKTTETNSTIQKKIGASSRTPRPLKLKTDTGFSRQFSDELGTPVEITNIVRMIDENIEETEEELQITQTDFMSRVDHREIHHRLKPSPPAGKLFLKLQPPRQPDISQTSSGSSIEDDVQPNYSIMGRQPFPPQRDMDYEPYLLEPQTPMTPAGFHTPGTDIDVDPLEVLRNLTISNDNLNRSAHGHF